ATIQELVVHVDRRRARQDRDRSLHTVLVRDESAAGLFRGRRDRQAAVRLQELQRVARSLRADLFRDGEDLVLERARAHVEERLTRHGRVDVLVLVGHEGERGRQDRRLAGRRARLDDDREWLPKNATNRDEIRDEEIRALADDTEAPEVVADSIDEPGIAQELERGVALGVRHQGGFRLRRSTPREESLLRLLEREKDATEIALERGLLDAELEARLLDERRAVPRRVDIEHVDMEANVLAADEDVDAHRAGARVVLDAPDAPSPLLEREDRFLGIGRRRLDGSCRYGRRSCLR